MSISYEAIGQVMVTCLAEDDVVAGQVVKMDDNDTVAACDAGDAFCGVAGEVSEDGFVAVQVKGFLTVSTTGTLTLGWVNLAADGKGGVKKVTSGGVAALVVSASDTGAVICL